jgi:membrane-associated protease RseP (regulator of RpoE activity)
MLNRKMWLLSVAALVLGSSAAHAQAPPATTKTIRVQVQPGQAGAVQQFQVFDPANGQRFQIQGQGFVPGQQIQIQGQPQIPDNVAVTLSRFMGNATSATLPWGGMTLKKTPSVLQEQLGLAKDKGLVVSGVDADSAAQKAGLKTNDVLLKIDGKDVPNDLQGLTKLAKDWKADAAVDAVVLRKGKEETLKAVKLPAIAAGANPFGAQDMIIINPMVLPRIQFQQAMPAFPAFPQIQPLPALPAFPRVQVVVNPAQQGKIINLQLQKMVNNAKVTIQQKNNDFESEYAEGELKITAKGKVENGVAKASSIVVTEGKTSKTYSKIEEVPQQFRDRVQQILPNANVIPFQPFGPLPGGFVPAVPAVPGVPLPGNDA